VTNQFDVGDSVIVKGRYRDAYIGVNLQGYQGRVAGYYTNPKDKIELEVDWDSTTLNSLPFKYLQQCARRQEPWEKGFLPPPKVEIVAERDKLTDVEQTRKLIRVRYRWIDDFGKSGERIFQVVQGKHTEKQEYAAWLDYLNETLKFPFGASVDYIDEIDDPELMYRYDAPDDEEDIRVLGLVKEPDYVFGLIAEISYQGKQYEFPLCNLEMGWLQPRRKYLEDYRNWFVSR